MSQLYPAQGIAGYSREEFLADLIAEAASDMRRCHDQGADSVQIDFTEARLSLKLDPTGELRSFVDLTSMSREIAFAKVKSRVEGTGLASAVLA